MVYQEQASGHTLKRGNNMVKQKLTPEEEKKIEDQLKLFVKPRTLPDIIRKALLSSKWFPESFEIFFDKGEIDDEQHYIPIETALKHFEEGNMSEIDKKMIARILSTPKIQDRIDYEFHGLITKVKNQMLGIKDEEPVKKGRKKSETVDLFGTPEKKPISTPEEKEEEIVKIAGIKIKNMRGDNNANSGNKQEAEKQEDSGTTKSTTTGISFDDDDE